MRRQQFSMYSRSPSSRFGPYWRERQFADAQALAHVGSWERAPSSDRAAWSDELCRIFGQPVGFSPTFDEFAQLIHPEDRDRVTRDLGRAESGVVYESRYRIVRPGGEIRHVCGRAGGRSDESRDRLHVRHHPGRHRLPRGRRGPSRRAGSVRDRVLPGADRHGADRPRRPLAEGQSRPVRHHRLARVRARATAVSGDHPSRGHRRRRRADRAADRGRDSRLPVREALCDARRRRDLGRAVGLARARRRRRRAAFHRPGGGHQRAQGGPAPPPGGRGRGARRARSRHRDHQRHGRGVRADHGRGGQGDQRGAVRAHRVLRL